MFTGDTVDTQAAKPIGFASSGSQLVVNVNPSNFKDDASMNEDRDPWGVRVVGRWWGIPTITPSDSGREYLGSCVPYIKMILCGLNSGDRSSQLCTRLSRPGSRFSPSPLHLDCTGCSRITASVQTTSYTWISTVVADIIKVVNTSKGMSMQKSIPKLNELAGAYHQHQCCSLLHRHPPPHPIIPSSAFYSATALSAAADGRDVNG